MNKKEVFDYIDNLEYTIATRRSTYANTYHKDPDKSKDPFITEKEANTIMDITAILFGKKV